MEKSAKPLNKISTRLTLRCLGAVALGVFVALLLSLSLSNYANEQEPDAATAAATPLSFPDSNEKLKQLAARMLAQDGQSLQDIAPAAGGAQSPPAGK
jgi:hypothetical protein